MSDHAIMQLDSSGNPTAIIGAGPIIGTPEQTRAARRLRNPSQHEPDAMSSSMNSNERAERDLAPITYSPHHPRHGTKAGPGPRANEESNASRSLSYEQRVQEKLFSNKDKIQRVFRELDRDGTGRVNRSEFVAGLGALGLQTTSDATLGSLVEACSDGNKVNYDQFFDNIRVGTHRAGNPRNLSVVGRVAFGDKREQPSLNMEDRRRHNIADSQSERNENNNGNYNDDSRVTSHNRSYDPYLLSETKPGGNPISNDREIFGSSFHKQHRPPPHAASYTGSGTSSDVFAGAAMVTAVSQGQFEYVDAVNEWESDPFILQRAASHRPDVALRGSRRVSTANASDGFKLAILEGYDTAQSAPRMRTASTGLTANMESTPWWENEQPRIELRHAVDQKGGLRKMAEIYRQLDPEGRGEVPVDSIQAGFTNLGVKLTKEQAHFMNSNIIPNDNGCVEYNSILQLLNTDIEGSRPWPTDLSNAAGTSASSRGGVYKEINSTDHVNDINDDVYVTRDRELLTDAHRSSVFDNETGTGNEGFTKPTGKLLDSSKHVSNLTLDLRPAPEASTSDHVPTKVFPHPDRVGAMIKGEEIIQIKSYGYEYDQVHRGSFYGIEPSDVLAATSGSEDVRRQREYDVQQRILLPVRGKSSRLRAAFKNFDISGAGTITPFEFKQAISHFGITLSDPEIARLVSASGAVAGGDIDYIRVTDYLAHNKAEVRRRMKESRTGSDSKVKDSGRSGFLYTKTTPSRYDVRYETGKKFESDKLPKIVRPKSAPPMRPGAVAPDRRSDAEVEATIQKMRHAGVKDRPESGLRQLGNPEHVVKRDWISTDDIRNTVIRATLGQPGRLREAFRAVDPHRTGLITPKEFRRALKAATGGALSESSEEQAIALLDARSGKVDYKTFLQNVSLEDGEKRLEGPDHTTSIANRGRQYWKGHSGDITGHTDCDQYENRNVCKPRPDNIEAVTESGDFISHSTFIRSKEFPWESIDGSRRRQGAGGIHSTFIGSGDILVPNDASNDAQSSTLFQQKRRSTRQSADDIIILKDRSRPLTQQEREDAKISALIMTKVQKKSKLADAFRQIDENHDGKVSQLEFRHALRNLGLHLKDADVDRLYNRFDRNKDGLVEYHEFATTIALEDVVGDREVVTGSIATDPEQSIVRENFGTGFRKKRVESGATVDHIDQFDQPISLSQADVISFGSGFHKTRVPIKDSLTTDLKITESGTDEDHKEFGSGFRKARSDSIVGSRSSIQLGTDDKTVENRPNRDIHRGSGNILAWPVNEGSNHNRNVATAIHPSTSHASTHVAPSATSSHNNNVHSTNNYIATSTPAMSSSTSGSMPASPSRVVHMKRSIFVPDLSTRPAPSQPTFNPLL